MLSVISCVQPFVTPWTIASQSPQLLCPLDFPGKNIGVGLPCSPPGELPNPGIKLMSLMSPALAGRFFTTGATWEAPSSQILRSNSDAGLCLYHLHIYISIYIYI